MRAASVFFFAGILALSAPSPHASFRYEILSSFRRSDDTCRICYADDCITMDESRCEYYVEADELLEKPAEEGEVTDVDQLMYELTEQATMSWTLEACIPFISQYSNCNKENICLGCQVCKCTSTSTWECAEVQRCRVEAEVDIDHRVIDVVMEKLMEDSKLRKKRSVENVTDLPTPITLEGKQMGLVEISNWMYGVTHRYISPVDGEDSTTVFTNPTEYITESTNSTHIPEPEYLDFEEVLKNIAIDDQPFKQTKSSSKDSYIKDNDYDYNTDLKDYKTKKRLESYSSGDQFMNVLNAIEEGKDFTEPTSTNSATLVIDLLPNNNDQYDNNNNVSYNADNINNIVYKEENNTITDDLKDILELDAVNVMKRDVLSVINLENTTQATNTSVTATTYETTTDKKDILKDSILIPLTNIIDDKANEVKELLQIKENLKYFISYFNYTALNLTSDSELINNNSTTRLSIYELDLFPDIQESLRKSNPRLLEKLLYKLKRDIYEVFKDVSRIHRVTKTADIPNELKKLIRAMQYFIHQQGGISDFKKNSIVLQDVSSSRRFFMRPVSTDSASNIKSQLIDMLDVLDKSTPQSNALAPISRSLKKILKRIINQNYVDDFSIVGLRVFDTDYNLTTDLRTIGKSLPQLTANVANSLPHEKLYAMKLLHFTLSGDIGKIKDAISLVDFAHSRRMVPNIETRNAEQIMGKINSGLSSIKRKVELLTKYRSARSKPNKIVESAKKLKKQSFLNKIRSMLRSSKKEILDMAKKKIPKTEIFKIIAKKKLNELSEKKDAETMIKWQNNLKIAKRISKRDIESQINSIKNRMKNIIPKYLRGKIDPAIAKTWKTKLQLATKKKTKPSKQKNLATPGVKATTSPMKTNKTVNASHKETYN